MQHDVEYGLCSNRQAKYGENLSACKSQWGHAAARNIINLKKNRSWGWGKVCEFNIEWTLGQHTGGGDRKNPAGSGRKPGAPQRNSQQTLGEISSFVSAALTDGETSDAEYQEINKKYEAFTAQRTKLRFSYHTVDGKKQGVRREGFEASPFKRKSLDANSGYQLLIFEGFPFPDQYDGRRFR
ncbi:MAG: hypothetical protein V6Z82_06700 [Flavobacteriales bacterium]